MVLRLWHRRDVSPSPSEVSQSCYMGSSRTVKKSAGCLSKDSAFSRVVPVLPKPHQDVVLPTSVPSSGLPGTHPHQVPADVRCQMPASAYLALDAVHPTVCNPLCPPAADYVLQLLPTAVCDPVCTTAAVCNQVCAAAAVCDPVHPKAAM